MKFGLVMLLASPEPSSKMASSVGLLGMDADFGVMMPLAE